MEIPGNRLRVSWYLRRKWEGKKNYRKWEHPQTPSVNPLSQEALRMTGKTETESVLEKHLSRLPQSPKLHGSPEVMPDPSKQVQGHRGWSISPNGKLMRPNGVVFLLFYPLQNYKTLGLYIQAKEASCPLWFAAKVVVTLENQEAGIQNEEWVSAMDLTGCCQAKITAKMQ